MRADPLDVGGNLGNDWILHGDRLTGAGVSGAPGALVDLIQLDHFAVRSRKNNCSAGGPATPVSRQIRPSVMIELGLGFEDIDKQQRQMR
jgi:hypothetical protein